MRFRHEYVWYHDRHFPINSTGISRYDKFREEYTQVTQWIPQEWFLRSASPSLSRMHYDPGAWVGWKDDLPAVGATKWVMGWNTAPALRWADAAYRGLPVSFQGETYPHDPQGGTAGKEYSSGGFEYMGNTVRAAGVSYIDLQVNPENAPGIRYTRRNIFDHSKGNYGMFPLAVGPELAVSREIHLNLTLPTELRD
jgi:hypothetical protein